MITTPLSRACVRFAALALLTTGAVSCGIDKQTAPSLYGPSEFALSLSLTATPDTIVANGESQSAIRVVARDPGGQPVPNLTVQFDVTVDQLFERPSLTQATVVTDANGQATTGLVAPPAPATRFSAGFEPVVTVTAVPLGTDFGNAATRSVQVRLVAPEGTPPGRPAPVAVIVTSRPAVLLGESITFDASFSTDQGIACNSRCDYLWEFPDNTDPVRAIRTEHVFRTAGTHRVFLNVTNDAGGMDREFVDVTVLGPAAPVANFSVSPSSPRVGTEVMFDASGSTVSSSATITRYTWDFGDSTTDTRDTPRAPKIYSSAGTFTVTLRVTDSLGREATTSSTITVVP